MNNFSFNIITLSSRIGCDNIFSLFFNHLIISLTLIIFIIKLDSLMHETNLLAMIPVGSASFQQQSYSIKANVRPSVRMSITFRGNVIFSAPNLEIAPIFFVQIHLIKEHLFCKYFFRLSVGNATKGFATYGCFHPCFY